MVERGPLKGREQEWNISRKELAELVRPNLACLHPSLQACQGHIKAPSVLRPVLSGKRHLTVSIPGAQHGYT